MQENDHSSSVPSGGAGDARQGEGEPQRGFYPERRSFDRLLVPFSISCLNAPFDQLDREVEKGLEEVNSFFGGDRVLLWEFSEDGQHAHLTHAYAGAGTELPASSLLHETLPYIFNRVRNLENLCVSQPEDLPQAARIDQQYMERSGIRSFIVIPLLVGGTLRGALSMASIRTDRVWSNEDLFNFQRIGTVIAGVLDRKRSHEMLERRMHFETLISDMSARLIKAPMSEVDREIIQALAQVREIFQADRCGLLGIRADRKFCWVTHASYGEGIEPVSGDINLADLFPWSYERLVVQGSNVNISRMEEQLQARLQEIEQLKQKIEQENLYLRQEAALLIEHGDIIGESAAMKTVLAQTEQVARTDSTVLISGETGTGKELLAREIHNLSSRKDRPLVTVNCASLPPTLIESELFGREKGAYTSAMTRMAGRFEVADGSTIFLDEIAELPLELQTKLLRVIEEGTFERLGSTKTIHVNVRIIAATNRDLSQEVQQGIFREDLFYRLNVFPITIPPLRERREDIPLLAWAFVRQFEKKLGKQIDSIPQRSMEALQRYSWPGNVRELRNVIEHAMIVTRDKTLKLRAPVAVSVAEKAEDNNFQLEAIERNHILTTLQRSGWRINGAAEALGLKRTTLHSKMKKLGIERPTN